MSSNSDRDGGGWHRHDSLTAIWAVFARERGLTMVGVAGVVLASLCLIAVAVRGRFIPPEGKMLDAATFCFGVGVFTLTVALLLPLAGFTPTGRRRWRRGFYVFAVYGLAVESIQAFRDLDPRFTEEGGTIDVIAGIIFGLTALSNTVLFVILGLRFFRSDVLADRPELRLGIRYGATAVTLSFAVGIVMSVNSGRDIGERGDLLLSHALGVHGIQAIPAVALLASAAGLIPPTTWLHAAGIGWLAACTAALIQAILGHPTLEPSILTALIVAGLAVWAAAAGRTLISWRPTTTTRLTSTTHDDRDLPTACGRRGRCGRGAPRSGHALDELCRACRIVGPRKIIEGRLVRDAMSGRVPVFEGAG